MSSSLQAIFADVDYCRQEIMRIREDWGNRKTFTSKMIEAARKVLGFMMLYGPEEIQPVVESTLEELMRREVLVLMYSPPLPENGSKRHEEKI